MEEVLQRGADDARRQSIIQETISEPMIGVMIIGSSEKKITGPLIQPGTWLTASAMTKPSSIASGVTTKV